MLRAHVCQCDADGRYEEGSAAEQLKTEEAGAQDEPSADDRSDQCRYSGTCIHHACVYFSKVAWEVRMGCSPVHCPSLDLSALGSRSAIENTDAGGRPMTAPEKAPKSTTKAMAAPALGTNGQKQRQKMEATAMTIACAIRVPWLRKVRASSCSGRKSLQLAKEPSCNSSDRAAYVHDGQQVKGTNSIIGNFLVRRSDVVESSGNRVFVTKAILRCPLDMS